MPLYIVRWEIDIHAENPQEAAEKARKIQLTPNTKATVFDVLDPAAPAKLRGSLFRLATIDLSCPEESKTYGRDGGRGDKDSAHTSV